jgi:hypothetical protein
MCDVSEMALLSHIPAIADRAPLLDHPWKTERSWMLDHAEKTARLLADLKAAVPFKVVLTPQLAAHLRAEHVAASAQPEHTVADLSYAGDEGGIVCHLAPSNAGGGIIVSLTHVGVPRWMPLSSAVLRYQKHRVKKLKKQGQALPR